MLKVKSGKIKTGRGEIAITTILWLVLAVGIAVVLFGGLGYVEGLTDYILNILKGKGITYTDISDSELGEAIVCVHWRCKEGCDYVRNMVVGNVPCPCEESWDTNGDGKICGTTESKTHPIKVELEEDTTVYRTWWKEEACEDTCDNAYLTMTSDCTHTAIAIKNFINLNENSGVDCGNAQRTAMPIPTYAQCTLPSDILYVWAFNNNFKTTSVVVCDERPAGMATCASECGGTCQSTPPSDPTCSGGNCVYYRDIGQSYCDVSGETCYCQESELCQCRTEQNQECTADGCKAVTSRSFFCCEVSSPRGFYWEQEPLVCYGNRADASNCDPGTCEEQCQEKQFRSSYYNPSPVGDDAYLCICSDPSDCSVYTTEAECPTTTCEWCDECQGSKLLSNAGNRNKCIDRMEYCGSYECAAGQCQPEAECSAADPCGPYLGCTDECVCEPLGCCYFRMELLGCTTEDDCYGDTWGEPCDSNFPSCSPM